MARFVVVVDTQRDFMAADGALSVAGADGLIGPMQAWLRGLDPTDTAGVLFTFDTHMPEIYAASSEAEAYGMADAAIKANPALRGTIQVISAFEAA